MQLGWIDYSKEERNKVVAILRMLGTQTTLDEIGIGTVRDGFSDKLFPGISTIQTRAKYFVLIPYIFQDAKKQRFDRKNNVLPWINRQEEQLVSVLLAKSDAKEEGIIGSRSFKQGQTVKQKPSSIYWNGMRTFEILRHSGLSIDNASEIVYLQSKKSREVSLKAEGESDGGDDTDILNDNLVVFSPIIPEYDYMKEASIDLTNKEAIFLFEKITRSKAAEFSLLRHMLYNEIVYEDFHSIDASTLPGDLKQIVQLSQDFADFIYGAHLLYNVIYSGETDMLDEFKNWRATDYQEIDIDKIASYSGCPEHTRKFILGFDRYIKTGDIDSAKQTIIDRERFIKRDRAKLLKPQEYRYEGALHNYKLNYRYSTAKTIVEDILKGLGRRS